MESMKSLTVRQDVNKLETAVHIVCEYLPEELTLKLCEATSVCHPKKLRSAAAALAMFNQGFQVPKRKFAEDDGEEGGKNGVPKPKEDYSDGKKFDLSPTKAKESNSQKKLKDAAKGTKSMTSFFNKKE